MFLRSLCQWILNKQKKDPHIINSPSEWIEYHQHHPLENHLNPKPIDTEGQDPIPPSLGLNLSW